MPRKAWHDSWQWHNNYVTFKKLGAKCKLSAWIIVKKRSAAGRNQDLHESELSIAKYFILIFIRWMTGGTPTLTIESTWLKPTRHRDRGPGAGARWPHCAIRNFFSLSALIPVKAKRSPGQQTCQLVKPASAKVNPPSWVSATAVMSGWMTVGACSRVGGKTDQG